jgi:hypothetical protein
MVKTRVPHPPVIHPKAYYRLILMTFYLLFLGACAGLRQVPPGTPEWIRQGPGPAIAEGTRYLYGIGVVGKMRSRVLLRTAADNKAKSKLSRAVNDYVEVLMAAYLSSPQAEGDTEAQAQSLQELRAVAGTTLTTSVIADHWQDPETGNYFALCRLEFSELLRRIASARILPPSLRRFAEKEGPLLFDRQSLKSEP